MIRDPAASPGTAPVPARYTPWPDGAPAPANGDRGGDTRRIAELDGLRGIAIALVILLHYVVRTRAGAELLRRLPMPLWATLDMSWCGVDLFFVISGFLIGGILLDNRESPRLLRVFYVRRACRILPLYLLLVALCFAPIFGGLSAASSSAIPLYAYLLFGQNIWTSTGVPSAHWLSPTWSVAIEEQFYLVAPFAVGRLSRRALVRVLIGCVVVAPLLRVASFYGLVHVASWDFSLCRIDAPAYGVLGAMLVRDERAMAMLRRHAGTLRSLLPVLLAGCVGLSQIALWPRGQEALLTLGLSYLAITALVLLLVTQLCPESLAARVARARPLVRLGQRSYFLYLFHTPVIGVLAILPVSDWGRVAGAVAILWLLAELSWRRVEEPILRLGRRQHYG